MEALYRFFKSVRLAIVLLILAIIDFIYQRSKTERDLRMTREEVKEELRAAWDEAQKEPAPDPSYYFGQVHASPSARLSSQLLRLERDPRA